MIRNLMKLYPSSESWAIFTWRAGCTPKIADHLSVNSLSNPVKTWLEPESGQTCLSLVLLSKSLTVRHSFVRDKGYIVTYIPRPLEVFTAGIKDLDLQPHHFTTPFQSY